ncbi:MAG: alpha/beta hydrolase [Chloroflexota bacterium]
MPSTSRTLQPIDSLRTAPLAQLNAFRASHPFKSIVLGGARWEYIACGTGRETLLLLPGAPGRGETAFQHILAFERHYRVISPSYPAEPITVGEMLAALVGIMSAEGIEQVHVVGGSYSGLIAQALVRAYADRVASLVLTDTGVPSRARAGKYTGYLTILEALPLFAIRALWRMGARLYLREIRQDRRFWRAYFRELIASISKEECVGRLKVWIDFDRNSSFSPSDLSKWPGKILILEAEHDTTFGPEERAALRRLYPQAQTRVFTAGGHAASLTRRGEYIEAIAAFLQGAVAQIEAAS